MSKKAQALLTLSLFLILTIAQSVNVNMAQANPHYQPPIDPGYYYIKQDGAVSPSSAPIQRAGNLYTLTDNITGHPLWINCYGAVLDGAGYTLKSNQSGFECGVTLNCTSSVTVKNLFVTGFRWGINIQQLFYLPVDWYEPYFPPNTYPKSSHNNITNCKLTDNKVGIQILYSSNNQISNNTIVVSQVGIQIQDTYGEPNAGKRNTIKNNQLKDNGEGILLESSDNTIQANQITQNNVCGVIISRSSNNIVQGNSITKNEIGILVNGAPGQGTSASANMITNNLIAQNNQWGIRLNGSQTNNKIYTNNFIDNNIGKGLQVSIPMYMDSGVNNGKTYVNFYSGLGNTWNTASTGNYWSDYQTRYPNATETSAMGIGDTPFYINENNIDNFPFTKPYANADVPLFEEEPAGGTSLQAFPTEMVFNAGLVALFAFSCIAIVIYARKNRKLTVS
jgi:parallel beta-helix repeat protein